MSHRVSHRTSHDVDFAQTRGLVVRTEKFLPPAQSKGISRDIDYFIELVALALEEDQHRKGITKGKRLEVKPIWPKQDIESPGGISEPFAITVVKTISREPGNTSPDRVRRPRRPWHQSEPVQHPDYEDMLLITRRQWMDNTLEFRVMSPHTDRSDQLALYFQDFMLSWEFYFKDMGIQYMHFDKRTEDELEEIGESHIYVRPLRYFVRTELVAQSVVKKLDQVNVEYDAGPGIKTTVIDSNLNIEDHTVVKPIDGNQL